MKKDYIYRARKANIEKYLTEKGETLIKEGKQYRVKNHQGLMVSDNKWYSHTLLKGGNTLDYLVKIENIDFYTAINILSEYYTGPIIQDNSSNNSLMIPDRYMNDKRVIAYLVKKRGIMFDILLPLLKNGRIYEASTTHNCVFTGIDKSNKIRYVMQRSTLTNNNLKFESRGSDKRFSFCLNGASDILFVFESPIDLLSYLTINYKHLPLYHHYMLSLGGVSDIALSFNLGTYTNIKKIVFCLDNDNAGIDAYIKYHEKYSNNGYSIFKQFPLLKDWNQQLLNRYD
jgi:hypothetical protein